MNRTSPEPPQFPAGPFVPDSADDDRRREAHIDEIERAPLRLREAMMGVVNEHLKH